MRSHDLLWFAFLVFSISTPVSSMSQERGYELNWKMDVPVLAGGAVLSISGNFFKGQIEPLSHAEIDALDASDINQFDRSAIGHFNRKRAMASDLLGAVAFAAPFMIVLNKDARSDLLPLVVMLAETALLTEGITSITKAGVKRSRPFVYSASVEMEEKQTKFARESFFSGHTAHTSAYSFFTASLIDHYSDNKTIEIIAWSGAVALPATVGLLRYSSGNHFPTDIIAGFFAGAGIGVLVPMLHETRDGVGNLQFIPGVQSLYLVWKF